MITKIIDSTKAAALGRMIDQASNIVIVCHTMPDGDAIGSSLAMWHLLRDLGKTATVIIPDMLQPQLRKLPGAKEAIDAAKYSDFAAKLISEASLLVCLDFNKPYRAGNYLASAITASTLPKVLIDHHLEPDDFCDVTISHPEQSSTCLLLYRVICALGLHDSINKTIATCLLAGMMTDTGNFAYNCDDPEAYIVVSDLVKLGASKAELYTLLFDTWSANRLKLNGYALYRKMEVFAEENAALITLTRDELNRFRYTKGDTEALVNRPLAIPEVKYSCFLREEDGYVKVSMRSVGSYDVSALCHDYFGGGGHLNAAGGEFKGTLTEAADIFRNLVKNKTIQK